MFKNKIKFLPLGYVLIGLLIAVGILFRFYRITDNQFIFYDEGYYLNYNYQYLKIIAQNSATNLPDIFKELSLFLRLSLRTGKALFFFLSDSRVFWGGLDWWFFPKVVAAVCGVLTFWITYIFAKRYFQSSWVGWGSVALLTILPGHVFYSRIGLQETLACLLFLTGLYLYLFPKEFGLRTFLSAIVLTAAYFSNYRLIVLPAIVFFCEGYFSLSEQRPFGFRKYLWHLLTFLLLIFSIGGLYNAENTMITFSWMFHQQDLAQQQGFQWFNLLSYPYYLVRLENILLGMLFFANGYYLIRRRFQEGFLFSLVVFIMLLFSFSSERGARYLCVAMPLISMSVIAFLFHLLKTKNLYLRIGLIGVVFLMGSGMLVKSWATVQVRTDYQKSTQDLLALSSEIKAQSTQPWVMNLYTPNRKDIVSCPQNYRYFLMLYAQGYRYLIIEPQVYVSWTKTGAHFDLPLEDFLEFFLRQIKPWKTYPHFNSLVMERFVFDHNQDLRRSIEFLNLNKDHSFGELRVYNIREGLDDLQQRVLKRNDSLERVSQ